jgi:hypothetical protein
MRKKSDFTIVEQAIVLVPEFEKVVRKLEQQVTLRGQSTPCCPVTSEAASCSVGRRPTAYRYAKPDEWWLSGNYRGLEPLIFSFPFNSLH